jgi:hypothetical protein
MILTKNILKYRKFLKKISSNKLTIQKYNLICDFNNFNGLGLKLLRLYFIKYGLSFNLYKQLFYKLSLKKTLSNVIYFQFSKFKSILSFIQLMSKLTIIPYFFFPLYITNKKKNILLPLNYLNLMTSLNLNKLDLLNLIIIKIIKNLIISIILKILKKIFKCQH